MLATSSRRVVPKRLVYTLRLTWPVGPPHNPLDSLDEHHTSQALEFFRSFSANA